MGTSAAAEAAGTGAVVDEVTGAVEGCTGSVAARTAQVAVSESAATRTVNSQRRSGNVDTTG